MAVPKHFSVVRFFGAFLKVLAWIVVVLSIIGAIGAVLTGVSSLADNLLTGLMPVDLIIVALGESGIIGAIAILIAGLVNFLIFYFAGEFLYMQLAVEENTRLTAALLLRMHQESRVQEEQEAYGDGGFISEAYE